MFSILIIQRNRLQFFHYQFLPTGNYSEGFNSNSLLIFSCSANQFARKFCIVLFSTICNQEDAHFLVEILVHHILAITDSHCRGLLRFRQERMHDCRGTHGFRGACRSRAAGNIWLLGLQLSLHDGFKWKIVEDFRAQGGVSALIKNAKTFSECTVALDTRAARDNLSLWSSLNTICMTEILHNYFADKLSPALQVSF